MVSVNHLSKSFRRNNVLKDINCELQNGIYGLLGPNGAGKTTLMRCMTNLYHPTSGNVCIDSVPIKKKQKKIGYLPQFFGLFSELTVQDSMKYFCNIKKIPRSEVKKQIERSLEAVNLSDRKKSICGKLSGGMLRRVGVAQALLGTPQLILFDEPTAGLDPEERMNFKRIVSDLGKEETVIISTHIVEDIEACCDYVIVMNHGEICYIGTCEELTCYAKGKVFQCAGNALPELEENYFLEKQYEYGGEVCYRILSQENQREMQSVEPTLEDGYMCMIKGL